MYKIIIGLLLCAVYSATIVGMSEDKNAFISTELDYVLKIAEPRLTLHSRETLDNDLASFVGKHLKYIQKKLHKSINLTGLLTSVGALPEIGKCIHAINNASMLCVEEDKKDEPKDRVKFNFESVFLHKNDKRVGLDQLPQLADQMKILLEALCGWDELETSKGQNITLINVANMASNALKDLSPQELDDAYDMFVQMPPILFRWLRDFYLAGNACGQDTAIDPRASIEELLMYELIVRQMAVARTTGSIHTILQTACFNSLHDAKKEYIKKQLQPKIEQSL